MPSALKRDVLCQMHDSLVSGHLGYKKTKQKILQKFYWCSLKEDVSGHIRKCDVCQADKKPAKTPRASLGSLLRAISDKNQKILNGAGHSWSQIFMKLSEHVKVVT